MAPDQPDYEFQDIPDAANHTSVGDRSLERAFWEIGLTRRDTHNLGQKVRATNTELQRHKELVSASIDDVERDVRQELKDMRKDFATGLDKQDTKSDRILYTALTAAIGAVASLVVQLRGGR